MSFTEAPVVGSHPVSLAGTMRWVVADIDDWGLLRFGVADQLRYAGAGLPGIPELIRLQADQLRRGLP